SRAVLPVPVVHRAAPPERGGQPPGARRVRGALPGHVAAAGPGGARRHRAPSPGRLPRPDQAAGRGAGQAAGRAAQPGAAGRHDRPAERAAAGRVRAPAAEPGVDLYSFRPTGTSPRRRSALTVPVRASREAGEPPAYPAGDLVIITGLPGAGKSTLLSRLYGLTGAETAPVRAGGVTVIDSMQSRL